MRYTTVNACPSGFSRDRALSFRSQISMCFSCAAHNSKDRKRRLRGPIFAPSKKITSTNHERNRGGLTALDRLLAFLQSQLAGGFLEPRGVDLAHDAVEVNCRLHALEAPGELDVRVEAARFVERPYFLAVIGGQKLGRTSPEEPSQVIHVANH